MADRLSIITVFIFPSVIKSQNLLCQIIILAFHNSMMKVQKNVSYCRIMGFHFVIETNWSNRIAFAARGYAGRT